MKQGFTLIECVVYLFLVALVSMCIVQVVVRFTLQSKASARYIDDVISVWIIATHIARDLRNASMQINDWLREDDCSRIAWKMNDRQYAWKVDEQKKLWRQENNALIAVADGIDLIQFKKVIVSGLVTSVVVDVRKRAARVKLVVPLYEWVFRCNC